MMMAEITVLEDLVTGKVERQCPYFKAKVLENHNTDAKDKTFENSIDSEQTIVLQIKVLLMLILLIMLSCIQAKKSN